MTGLLHRSGQVTTILWARYNTVVGEHVGYTACTIPVLPFTFVVFNKVGVTQGVAVKNHSSKATVSRYSQNVSFPTLTCIINHSIPAPSTKNRGSVLYTPRLVHNRFAFIKVAGPAYLPHPQTWRVLL